MNVARMLSGSMSADFDRDQLLNIFVAEAGDDMKRFWEALHPKGKTHPEPPEVAEFHTVGHKLKGAALLYGFAGLGRLGALLEDTLEGVHEIPIDRWPDVLQLIRDIVVSFRNQVERIGVAPARTHPVSKILSGDAVNWYALILPRCQPTQPDPRMK